VSAWVGRPGCNVVSYKPLILPLLHSMFKASLSFFFFFFLCIYLFRADKWGLFFFFLEDDVLSDFIIPEFSEVNVNVFK